MQAEKSYLSELIARNHSLELNCQRLHAANQLHTDDAAELRRSNAQLNQALAALTQMQSELLIAAKNAALGSLVAGVSHELSTPVGNSLIAASTIQHQADAFRIKAAHGISRTDLADFIQTVHAGAEMLMRNLERAATLVADFKRVSGDRTHLSLCTFNLHDAVQTVVAATLLRESQHRVVNAVPRHITLHSHLGALGEVLSELISNALRHGFHGREAGTIGIACSSGGDGLLELSIEDDGRGICPEHLGRIFDPFFTTTLGQGGSGLGLHAVYNLVHVTLRGEVRVHSERTRGTRFTLAIPMTLSDA